MGTIGIVRYDELLTSTLLIGNVNAPALDSLDNVLANLNNFLAIVCFQGSQVELGVAETEWMTGTARRVSLKVDDDMESGCYILCE